MQRQRPCWPRTPRVTEAALIAEKAALRARALAARAGLALPGAGEGLAVHLLAAAPARPSIIAGFWRLLCARFTSIIVAAIIGAR